MNGNREFGMSAKAIVKDISHIGGPDAWFRPDPGNPYVQAGIGTLVRNAPTVGEALKKAGLDFEVKKRQHYFYPSSSDMNAAPQPNLGSFALVRSDTNEPLATVGKEYAPFQTGELAELVQVVSAEHGLAIDAAFSRHGGKQFGFIVPIGPLKIHGVDEVHRHLTFIGGHDGGTGVSITPGTLRRSCLNSLELEMYSRSMHARHDGNLAANIENMRRALQGLPAQIARIDGTLLALADRKLSVDEMRAFLWRTYAASVNEDPTELGAIAAKPDAASVTDEKRATAKRAMDTLEVWWANLTAPENIGMDGELGGMTAWHGVNAVTQWVDHQRKSTPKGRENLGHIFGQAARIKQHALTGAMALVGVGGGA